jgi:hypothetical protein
MNARTQTSNLSLALDGTDEFPRNLRLNFREPLGLSLWMFPRDSIVRVAYASNAISKCRLDFFAEKWSLWIGDSAFDLSADEMAAVLDAFGPIGLKIKSAFPCAGTPRSLSAKQAVAAAAPSSEDGTSPSPASPGGGALEEAYDHFAARFLVANESY